MICAQQEMNGWFLGSQCALPWPPLWWCPNQIPRRVIPLKVTELVTTSEGSHGISVRFLHHTALRRGSYKLLELGNYSGWGLTCTQ